MSDDREARTTWSRLEPRTRDPDDMQDGLRAQVRDPLWLLSRQWQVNELRGEDAGSPVDVSLTVAEDDLTRVDLRGGGRESAPPFDYDGGPLEATVEREAVVTHEAGPPARLRVEGGTHFLRTLAEHGYGEYAAADFPADLRFAPDDEPKPAADQRYVELMADRALDGRAVFDAIAAGTGNVDAVVDGDAESLSGVSASALPLPSDGSRDAAFDDAVVAFYGWFRDLYEEPEPGGGSAWDPRRMEYRFAVATGSGDEETVLEAPGYEGGHLDWWAFSPAGRSESLATRVARYAARADLDDAAVRLPSSITAGVGDPRSLRGARSIEAVDTPAKGEQSADDTDPATAADEQAGGFEPRPRFDDAADAADAAGAGASSGPPMAFQSGPGPGTSGLGSVSTPGRDLSIPDRLTVSVPSLDQVPDSVVDPPMPSLWTGDTPWDATETTTKRLVPSKVSFPGMPAARWWEMEESDVNLGEVAGDGASIARLLLVEFAAQYGNDWFRIPVETAVGSLSRVTDLTVTDAFGVTETAEPAIDDDWQLYGYDLPGSEEVGLFVPPTVAGGVESDPVEQVFFGRDETANLAFGIERVVEGPTGRPVDRTEFQPPKLVVDGVNGADDPDEEYVRVANPGEDDLDLSGLVLSVEVGETSEVVYEFGDRRVPPRGTLSVRVGEASDPDAVGAGHANPKLRDADAVTVREGTGEEGRVVVRKLLAAPSEAMADYRLSTDVPDYWYPFVMQRDDEEYRLARALLLDADTLGVPVEHLPMPRGKVLDPETGLLPADEDNLRLFEEEVTRSGLEVTRRYQLTTWTDGAPRLWSTRTARTGDTQLSSGLRFDVLAERDDQG